MPEQARRYLAICLICIITNCLLSSCSSESIVHSPIPSAGSEDGGGLLNPSGKTLQYWLPLSNSVSPNFKNLGDTPMALELEKRTGIKIKYIHPIAGRESEAFNLLIASGDIPDLVEYGWGNTQYYPYGPDSAIENNLILRLNDIIEQYAPNYKAVTESMPDMEKAIKTDSGNYYGFTFYKEPYTLLLVYQGLAIRNDWLAEAGLSIPETIDEWYTALKAFKDRGVKRPLSWAGAEEDPLRFFNSGFFVGAYGINRDFYLDDGIVRYGPAEPGYRDFLAEMARWYKEGLIDPGFATMDRKAFDSAFLSGGIGAFSLLAGGGFSKYIPALAEADPKGDLQPAPYPVLTKGEKPQFGHLESAYSGVNVVAISAKCADVETAAKWLDYGYSEEGRLLYNYGIEGVSYTMVDGKPLMTDEIMKNPKGLSVAEAWCHYARAPYSGPFLLEKDMQLQYRAMPIQNRAVEVWMETDMQKHLFPNVTLTAEENARFAELFNNIKSYSDDYSLKVVMGEESGDKYGEYIGRLKAMGIEEVIQLQQQALTRYNNR